VAKVAIQGEPGSYSEETALAALGSGTVIVPCRSLEDVFLALTRHEVDGAVIPVENSRAGSVAGALELLAEHPFPVLGEWELPVHHCLMALPGETLASITEVYSHPQALAQCRGYLDRLPVKQQAWYDTAGSARHIAQGRIPHAAAIASRHAANLYGLEVLAENIEDASDNVTRFYFLGLAPKVRHPRGEGRTVFVFGTPDVPGALVRCLLPFAHAGINLQKLESRPNRREPFAYTFYGVVTKEATDPVCAKALQDLAQTARYYRLLGSYQL
jgi:prephenate dehydratase